MIFWVLGVIAYLAVGYGIGLLTVREKSDPRPNEALGWREKIRRFFLYPCSFVVTGTRGFLINPIGILASSIFFWPLRWLLAFLFVFPMAACMGIPILVLFHVIPKLLEVVGSVGKKSLLCISPQWLQDEETRQENETLSAGETATFDPVASGKLSIADQKGQVSLIEYDKAPIRVPS